MTDSNELKAKLTRLQLKAMAQSLDSVLEDARQSNSGFPATLSRLTDLELERRWQSGVKLRWD